MQFTDFLMNGVRKMDEISRIMPTMRHLLETVGLSVPVAFQLARPLMRAALQKSKWCGVVWCHVIGYDVMSLPFLQSQNWSIHHFHISFNIPYISP